MSKQKKDSLIMKRLLRLAASRKGATKENPTVAAAIYREGVCVAEGVHEFSGKPHAEIVALEKAGDLSKGATMYVTLEPCTHTGKTPPCVEAVVQSGISELVYAVDDPNPKVMRKPAKMYLNYHGITVRSGVCEQEACCLNDVYFKWIRTQKPFFSMKAGVSLDGRIAMPDGSSCYITSQESRKYVHRLRRQYDAVLVGSGTVLQDNPQLNIRYNLNKKPFKTPHRLILDSYLKVSLTARCIAQIGTENVVVFYADLPEVKPPLEHPKHVIYCPVPYHQERLSWQGIVQHSANLGIRSVFIEGGESVFSSALDAGIVDKGYFFIAPTLLMARKAYRLVNSDARHLLSDQLRLSQVQYQKMGSDILCTGYFNNDWYNLSHMSSVL